ncbi:hypothetical protein [Myceligenerans pegani]|uniref:Lipoprotein n=1 Tax=Myceligenerans pegani TaxID=2776917 RepID=A0ABR9MU74_9MICO|nr:hypothetical protein [Myceligenerans sp. TRM 65318]MBE1874616.1 hypothetical protein [Myceligenerans sp. TRM 65318]MBE3016887.1 hypothetical protein [Myceligenerans sp. TRM 65318]
MDHRNARFVRTRIAASALITGLLAAALAGCSVPRAEGSGSSSEQPPAAVRAPEDGVLTLDSDDSAELALHASQALFDHSPVVVLATVDDAADRMTAGATGEALAAPVLLGGGVIDDAGLRNELERLRAESLVVVGDEEDVAAAGALAGGLDVVRFDPDAVSEAAEEAVKSVQSGGKGTSVGSGTTAGAGTVTGAAVRSSSAGTEVRLPEAGMIDTTQLRTLREQVPEVEDPDQLSEVMLLIDPAEGQEAAIGTARAAGAVPLVVPGGDPGARKDAISRITTADPLGVVAIGPGFSDRDRLAWQVDAARRGVTYPHGTQRLAGETYVATSFTVPPGADPAETAAAATEARAIADAYGGVPVVSVAASVKSSSPGEDGDYVASTPVEDLTAVVSALRDAGTLVLLDVVPGNRPLAEQIGPLEALLATPGVGLALHPEFRVAGNGVKFGGHVPVAELQAAVDRVAGIVSTQGLPQTMVVVHQSRAQSVDDRGALQARAEVATVFAAAAASGGGATATGVWYDVVTDLPDRAASGWAGPPTGAIPPSDPAPPLLITTD